MSMIYSDEQLLNRVKSLPSFDGWPKGVLDIWVRSRADAYNSFDDKVYSYDCDSGEPVFKMVCTGTSHAGAFGLKRWRTYNSEGCAVLKTDTVFYYAWAYGLHKGKPGYRQVKGVAYYRDFDGDNHAEEIGLIHKDIIGANCHRAGVFSSVIGNWSVACLVRNRLTQFLAWLKFMDRRPLSVVILKEF